MIRQKILLTFIVFLTGMTLVSCEDANQKPYSAMKQRYWWYGRNSNGGYIQRRSSSSSTTFKYKDIFNTTEKDIFSSKDVQDKTFGWQQGKYTLESLTKTADEEEE